MYTLLKALLQKRGKCNNRKKIRGTKKRKQLNAVYMETGQYILATSWTNERRIVAIFSHPKRSRTKQLVVTMMAPWRDGNTIRFVWKEEHHVQSAGRYSHYQSGISIVLTFFLSTLLVTQSAGRVVYFRQEKNNPLRLLGMTVTTYGLLNGNFNCPHYMALGLWRPF